MRQAFFKHQFLKMNKLKCGLFVLIVGSSIVGIVSYNKSNLEEVFSLSQREIANVLSVKSQEKDLAKSSYFLEEKPDPAISVFKQFDYIREKKVSATPKIQQIEDEVEQLAIVFEKEKSKEKLMHDLENLPEQASSKNEVVVEHQVADPVLKQNTMDNEQISWQKPQIILSSSYLILEQNQVFEPQDYFKIVTGSDPSPKITHNFIDTSKLGEQKFSIQVTDSMGNISHSKVNVLINSLPTINLAQPILQQYIDQPIDLLQGVTAFDHEDGELTSKIEVTTNLDINKEGIYDITYLVTDRHGAKTTAKAVMKVINDAPMIHIPEVIEHKINHHLDIFDYIKVIDTEDGRIPLNQSNIVESNIDFRKEGDYFFKIGNVKDHHGKLAEERSVVVRITNEAPKIIHADIQVNVFSLMKKEDYLNQLIVSDREDAAEMLKIELDQVVWKQIDTTKLKEYILPIVVTDTNEKTTNGYSKITVINESPQLIGVTDRELMIGEEFDPLAGITVYDQEEPLTLENVEVTETVDVNVPGTYTVQLSISDSFEKVMASYQLTIAKKS